jgi:hypothetical protein
VGKATKKGVSLGVDLGAAEGREGIAQEGSVLCESVTVAITEALQKAGGALDVGEDPR